MKNIFILFLLLIGVSTYSQKEKKKFSVEYLNMTSLSITKNTESYYSNFSKDSVKTTKGLGFDLNTIHGVRFFNYVCISVGVSVDWNINKTFLSTPVIYDIRVFSSKSDENSLFFYLQTGQNIKWSNSFNGGGTSSKLGIGAVFNYDENISYYFDIYKKSKQVEIEKYKEKGNYNANGFGISLGVIF